MSVSLKQVTMFNSLDETALKSVEAALKRRQLKSGEILFNMGDPGLELIIVEEGAIAIFVPVAGSPYKGEPIRIFQPGEMLGEMALIDQKPRSLSARADEDSQILTLNGSDFKQILTRNPEMSLAIMAGLSDRIRYTTDFLAEVRAWVKRIAEGNYETNNLEKQAGHKDQTLASLAGEFAQMAARVQEREETLRREVAQLRIEIDEAKRKQDVSRIMGSEYYKSLKEKAAALRKKSE